MAALDDCCALAIVLLALEGFHVLAGLKPHFMDQVDLLYAGCSRALARKPTPE